MGITFDSRVFGAFSRSHSLPFKLDEYKAVRREQIQTQLMTRHEITVAVWNVVKALWPDLIPVWSRRAKKGLITEVLRAIGRENCLFYRYRELVDDLVEHVRSTGDHDAMLVLRSVVLSRVVLGVQFDPASLGYTLQEVLNLEVIDLLPNIRRGLIDDHYEVELTDNRILGEFLHLHFYFPRSDRPSQPYHSHRFDIGFYVLCGVAHHTIARIELCPDGERELLKVVDTSVTSAAKGVGARCNVLVEDHYAMTRERPTELFAHEIHSVNPVKDREMLALIKFEKNPLAPTAFSVTMPDTVEVEKIKWSGRFFTLRFAIDLVARVDRLLGSIA